MVMTSFRVAALSGFLLLCSGTLASETLKAEVEVFRVFPVFESEGSRRVARSELGCDPCEELTHRDHDGRESRYFLNPDAGVQLGSSAVANVGAESDEQGAVAFVTLTDQGRTLIESLIANKDDVAANLVDGEVISLVPLRMFGSRYVVAFAPTEAAAEEIVRLLRDGRR